MLELHRITSPMMYWDKNLLSEDVVYIYNAGVFTCTPQGVHFII